MSDPVTNAEVEDVLSSIRRLVSEDKRPLKAPEPPQSADRLVLTPALRVAEQPDEKETAREALKDEAAEAAAEPAPDIPSINSLITDDAPLDVYGDMAPHDEDEWGADAPVEEETASFDDAEAAVKEPTDNPEPEFDRESDDLEMKEAEFDEDDDAFLLKTLPEEDEAAETENADPSTEIIADDWDDEAEDDLTEDLRISLREAMARDDAKDAVTDAAEPATFHHSAPSSAVSGMPDIADPHETPEETAEATDAEAEMPAAGVETDKSVALSTKIAALETAIGKIADTWEPDDPGESDYAGDEPDTMAWQDDTAATGDEPPAEAAEAEVMFVRHEPSVSDDAADADFDDNAPVLERDVVSGTAQAGSEGQAAAAGETGPALRETNPAADETPTTTDERVPLSVPPVTGADRALDLSAEEQLIDEEALRDLVSEIVRSELQGALGERITRNVRKLVRREIHRALTAQDLE